VLLIGGTSNVGKSTVAEVLAARLGFEHRSTDYLARHPGRPWRTHEREVPPHVAEHYSTLSVDELIASVLAHYERLWPRIEDLIRIHTGLVLEGSALLPARVATLSLPDTTAVWLTADDAVLQSRIRAAGDYRNATADERALMDKFLARTVRFQELVLADVHQLGLVHIQHNGRSISDLTELVLTRSTARR
jgi:2-phosphoglycerate kinase